MPVTQTEIINEWMVRLKADLIAEYNRLGLKSSGGFADSLTPFNTDKRAIMFGARYSFQMENGRLAGTWPPRKAIEDWIDKKKIVSNIPKSSLAFLIQRKIFREGIKVPNKFNKGGVISNVITEARIDELVNRLKFINVIQFTSQVFEILKTA
jgi:hypothetical protein